jgi:hypothetical protein
MKALSVIIFLLFTIVNYLTAQKNEIITVKPGTKIADYFPVEERFRYSEFKTGKVVLKNKKSNSAMLNYNLLAGEMQFIQNRDTLSITNFTGIDYIKIDNDLFYCDNGFLEVVSGQDPAIMAVKQYVKIVDTRKVGAYGSKNSTSAVETYANFFRSRNYEIVVNEELVLSKEKEYYIGNTLNGFVLFRKNYLLKLFPRYKSDINTYINSNQVDFRNKEDLIKLTGFLQEIL